MFAFLMVLEYFCSWFNNSFFDVTTFADTVACPYHSSPGCDGILWWEVCLIHVKWGLHHFCPNQADEAEREHLKKLAEAKAEVPLFLSFDFYPKQSCSRWACPKIGHLQIIIFSFKQFQSFNSHFGGIPHVWTAPTCAEDRAWDAVLFLRVFLQAEEMERQHANALKAAQAGRTLSI